MAILLNPEEYYHSFSDVVTLEKQEDGSYKPNLQVLIPQRYRTSEITPYSSEVDI